MLLVASFMAQARNRSHQRWPCGLVAGHIRLYPTLIFEVTLITFRSCYRNLATNKLTKLEYAAFDGLDQLEHL